MQNVGERLIEDLLDQPEVDDEETRAGMRLISLLGPPAYFRGADVLTFLVIRATNLSLVHGPSPYSAYAYAFYAGFITRAPASTVWGMPLAGWRWASAVGSQPG